MNQKWFCATVVLLVTSVALFSSGLDALSQGSVFQGVDPQPGGFREIFSTFQGVKGDHRNAEELFQGQAGMALR